MLTAGQTYPGFDWSMNPQNFTFSAAFYGPGYDVNRTPTTSGSDESMDSRVNPKLSPKYREKRNKNNAAAKKSRAQRKQREMDSLKENNSLREKNANLEANSKAMVEQLHQMEKQMREIMAERELLQRRLAVYEQPGEIKFPHHEAKFPLTEINGQLHSNFIRTYENLN